MAILNRALNNQIKFYGLKAIGVVFGGLFFILGTVLFSMLFGFLTMSVGYFIGSMVADLWHAGILQKNIYWYLPLKIPNTRSFIPSHKRYFL